MTLPAPALDLDDDGTDAGWDDDPDDTLDDDGEGEDDGLVPLSVGIVCAESQVFRIPATVRVPPDLADGVRRAVAEGRADDWHEDMDPAMRELYEWLDDNREQWEDQLNEGTMCQDAEDLEIRHVELG
jgi:hypothetical protein